MTQTDIAIIGQGLAGSMLAWHLDQAGADFIVIDDTHRVKSSTRAGGLFNPLMFNKLRMARMTNELWPIMNSTYKKMEDAFSIQLIHNYKSVKMLNSIELSEWKLKQDKDPGKYIEEIIENPILAGIEKYRAMGVIKESGYLDISQLLNSIKNKLFTENTFINTSVDYDQITIYKDYISINNSIKAKRVVFCEGAGGVENPWFGKAGLTPNKGELMEISAHGLDNQHIIRDKVFILPLENGHFKIGATYSHPENLNIHPTNSGLMELREKLEKMINIPYQVIKQYAGSRPAVRDRMPLLGSHPDYPRLMTFNGLGSKGVAYAPYCANIMKENLVNPKSKIPDALNVIRYIKPKK